MVDCGQDQIAEVAFESQPRGALPVEVVERSALLARLGIDYFASPQRPSFYLMFLGRSGIGTHKIDFESLPLRAGRLVLVRPGQVQLWDTASDFEASVVLARSDVAPGQIWFPGDSAHRDLGADSLATAEALMAAIGREQSRFAGAESSGRLMRALFLALLALFDSSGPKARDGELPPAYVAFRAAVEADVTRSRNVRDYVAGLGFSERTVNRACQHVTGRSAKGLLDDRLVLEAKRLLAHTNEPAAGIAARLGFSESTNFAKFFARHTAQLPSAFRDDLRAAGYEISDNATQR